MAECAFCGASLRPGATFCLACGHDAAARPAPAGGAVAGGVTGPRKAAALALAGMPTALVLFVVVMTATLPGGPDTLWFAILFAGTGAVYGLAWAVARGAAWARWTTLVATLAWGAFMVWTVPSQISLLRDPYFGISAAARRGAVLGLGLVAIELLLCGATLLLLFRPARPEKA